MSSGCSSGPSRALTSAMSTKKKKLRMDIGSSGRPEDVYVPFSLLGGCEGATIKAMVCRTWDATNPFGKYLGTEFILSDDKGDALHCIARNTIAHCVVPKLEVGCIYSISRFSLVNNKETYRVRCNDPYLIQLEGNTIIRRLECAPNGFQQYSFLLHPFDDISVNGSQYLIDVVGRVVNVGVTCPTKNGSQFLDFHLLNESGVTIKVTVWGDLSTQILNNCWDPISLYVIILPAMNVKEYKEKGILQLSSTCGTAVFDNADIPQIAELRKLMGDNPIPPTTNPGSLLTLLQLGREQNEDPTLVKIIGVRPQNSWNYYSCGIDGCRKLVKPQSDHFWCDACDHRCEFPVIRYLLQLEIQDNSTSLVATVFDEIAESLLKKKPSVLIEQIGEDLEENEIPNEILNLIGSEHSFEIKSHTYYNHDYYETFTVSRVQQCIHVGHDAPTNYKVENGTSVSKKAEIVTDVCHVQDYTSVMSETTPDPSNLKGIEAEKGVVGGKRKSVINVIEDE